ncbi:hypothetical protein [Streptomyces sp. NBC_00425]|uniref:hypothetical protein n=1 Tax=Streptomyces sp. NBC_00425 TaxID=2975740 RepID=UPI002E207385
MSEHTLYYRNANGSVSRVVTSLDADDIRVQGGTVQITEAEYQEAYAEIQRVNEEGKTELATADRERHVEDYEALRAAGIPEATARRLSGYTSDGDM